MLRKKLNQRIGSLFLLMGMSLSFLNLSFAEPSELEPEIPAVDLVPLSSSLSQETKAPDSSLEERVSSPDHFWKLLKGSWGLEKNSGALKCGGEVIPISEKGGGLLKTLIEKQKITFLSDEKTLDSPRRGQSEDAFQKKNRIRYELPCGFGFEKFCPLTQRLEALSLEEEKEEGGGQTLRYKLSTESFQLVSQFPGAVPPSLPSVSHSISKNKIKNEGPFQSIQLALPFLTSLSGLKSEEKKSIHFLVSFLNHLLGGGEVNSSFLLKAFQNSSLEVYKIILSSEKNVNCQLFFETASQRSSRESAQNSTDLHEIGEGILEMILTQ